MLAKRRRFCIFLRIFSFYISIQLKFSVQLGVLETDAVGLAWSR